MARKNVSDFRIADRYVAALFPLAEASGGIDTLAAELAQLAALMKDDAAFAELASTPAIAPAAKGRIVETLLTGWKADPLTLRFALRLAAAGRLSTLPAIARAFDRLAAEKRGELRVDIVSARALTSEQQRALEQGLSAGSAPVKATVTVDPSLIAGVIVRRGSRQLDYSLAGKLRQIRAAAGQQRATA